MTRFAFLALLAAALLASGSRGQEEERPPNVVLILIDDLGWTDLGCFGSEFYETPNIDRLCDEGMKLTSAYSNGPNCAPTRASLLTGKYTPRHGITQVGARPRGKKQDRKLVENPSRTSLRPDEILIAERLKPAGYVSAAIGKWHCGGGESAPAAHGFDVDITFNNPGHFAPYRRELPVLGRGEDGEYLTDRLTDEAVRFVEDNRDRPFFLYLAHHAVHTPVQSKEALQGKYREKGKRGEHWDPVYAAMIESVDESVGRVVATLERLDLTDDTVVIFASDNGGHERFTSNLPLRGGKGMLYEGGIRVPAFVRWPGVVEAKSACDVPIVLLDLYPTILEIAGAEPAPEQILDGESLVPLLSRRGDLTRDAVFWHFPHYLQGYIPRHGKWRTVPAGALRSGRFKLIEFFEDGRLELYDLEQDLGETHDLAAEMPERTKALHDELRSWRDAVGARMPRPIAR